MKLTFVGAAREVTGSCTLVEAAGHRFLVDCGMEQGRDVYENIALPCAPGEIEALLLTHAHIDHSGRVPYLYKNGFRGPVFCTDATMDLCEIMLEDSAHIQEQEAEWKNRKAQRSGREIIEPDYTVQDAAAVMRQFLPQHYNAEAPVFPGITVRFTDVGHLLGSASLTLTVTEEGQTQTIVFSGDIGNLQQPILREPHYLEKADFVVMESTYGTRLHDPQPDYVAELAEIIQQTFDKGGNVVIPSFAVGRTQEMLYFIREIKEKGLVKGHGEFPVWVDSPLAEASTQIFRDNYKDCYDEKALALVESGRNPLQFPGLHTSESKEDSIAINTDPAPKVIISASGMCDAGRIRHHLKHNLWRPECTILFVGFQSGGTLGRALLEGLDEVKLFGETVQVNANIQQMSGMSGHADKDGLETWITHFTPRPGYVFVNHGDDEVAEAFAAHLRGEGFAAEAPYNGSVYLLVGGQVGCLEKGNTQKLAKAEEGARTAPDRRENATFERLVNMGKRLQVVIEHNRGGANKDMARFASQIASLCDKWDR